jgi:hypothetical protein
MAWWLWKHPSFITVDLFAVYEQCAGLATLAYEALAVKEGKSDSWENVISFGIT